MTPEAITLWAGAALAAIFEYVPGLHEAYNRQSATSKQAIMGIMLAVTAFGAVAWTCTGVEGTTFETCMAEFGWRSVATTFIMALIANQSTHRIIKRDDSPRKEGMPVVPAARFPVADTTLPPKSF